jgi:hypothetical protein
MAKSKNSFTAILLAALVVAALVGLNPTTADFKAWRSGQAERQATSGDTTGLVGVMKKGAGAFAGALTGAVAGAYERKNYYVCSTYELGGDLYLGVARLFLKLK